MNGPACWLWDRGDPAPRNTVLYFRRSFQLEVATQAQLHLSADCRYLLFLDGERLGYGPARTFHAHAQFDSYPLELRAGAHVLAVQVLHWGESTYQHVAAQGGLIAQLEDSSGAVLLCSDRAWRVQRSRGFARNTPRVACQLAFEEQYDARLEPGDWTALGFDDSAWDPAQEIGPLGMAPWGDLSPRRVPFLTDEPISSVQLTDLGVVRRPEAVAALHGAPSLVPGDLSSNNHTVDALIATVLSLPTPGDVTIKRCSLYGTVPGLLLEGVSRAWQRADCDAQVTVPLEAGHHVVLLDWQGNTHDFDLSLSVSGVPGLVVRSPLEREGETWMLATAPGDARAAAREARTLDALLGCGAAWQAVPSSDTPPVDVYMDLTASVPQHGGAVQEQVVHLPLSVAPCGVGRARHYLVDFGRLLIGWMALELSAPEGTVIDLLGCEGMQEGQLCIPESMNNTLRYTCRKGRQRFVSSQRRGLRYALIAVHSHEASVVVHALELRLSTHPWQPQGEFCSSDPRLDQIYALCLDTQRLCSEDAFTDCPTYEQATWVGDAAHSSVLQHLYAHGDPRICEHTLTLAAQSLERLPLANSQVPGDWETMLIPNWSFLWALGCEEHHRLTGDDGFARALYPALARQAATVQASRNAQGLFEFERHVWHFLDWSGLDTPPGSLPAHESCLAVAALRSTAALARVADQPDEALHWESVAQALGSAVQRSFWSEQDHAFRDSLYADGSLSPVCSQPTNICAWLAGLVSPQDLPRFLAQVAQPPAGWVRAGTPWMTGFVGRMLAENGQVGEMLELIRERWGAMLDRGATTAWEVFPGFMPHGVWTRSWCHAWSASPLYLLPGQVLGVRPLEPGFKWAHIAPELGDLSWLRGRVPTPHGAIEVSVQADPAEQWRSVSVLLPHEVSARLSLRGERERPPHTQTPQVTMYHEGEHWHLTLPPGSRAEVQSASNADPGRG